MADRPLEFELMMSTYTQLGRNLPGHVDHLDVFVPSGVEENDLGFDMQIPNLKGIVFQFKRPKGDDPLRFRVRYSDQDLPRQLDRMRNWELKFGPDVAFYALPMVTKHSNLEETLKRTAFLPASVIDPLTSIIRIPPNYIENGKRVGTEPIELYQSQPNNPSVNATTTRDSTRVLGWEGLKEEVGACDAGFWLRREGRSRFQQYDKEQNWFPNHEDSINRMPLSEFEDLTHELFVEAQSPIFTRLGAETSLGW